MEEMILRRIRWWGDRWLLTLACSFAVLSLALAAIDQIESAGFALLAGIAFGGLHFLSWLYRRLPDSERVAFFNRGVARRFVVISMCAAVVMSHAYWFGGWMPNVGWPSVLVTHIAKLDFIPSAFSLLLPGSWRSGFHHYFRSMTYCFPGPFWWESMRYLRTAVPAYALVFFGLLVAERLAIFTIRRRAH